MPDALWLALALVVAPPAAIPLPQQSGEELVDPATADAVIADSYRYFTLKDGGRYDAAYALLAPSMQAYLKPDFYREQSAQFNREAGPVEERRIVKLTWERDPKDAPEPGLYVAADFTSRFPNIYIHCGYLMWRQQPDRSFRIVREEQSFVDTVTAGKIAPERRSPLRRQFGCVDE